MLLNVSDIRSQGKLQKDQTLDGPSVLGPSPDFVYFNNPIDARVSAQMTEGDIYVKGQIQTVLTFNCARCLNSFERPFKGQFSQVFKPEIDKIDLSNDIRETVMVDLPLKPLCQGDCRGLCPSCGINLNSETCSCSHKGSAEIKIKIKNLPK